MRTIEIEAKTIINRMNDGFFAMRYLPFRLTVNIYRGCTHGCPYCYAARTHYYMRSTPDRFSESVYVKVNAAELFEREISKRKKRGKLSVIVIGNISDTYQPIETKSVVLQILQSHGRLQCLVDLDTGHTGLHLGNQPVQQHLLVRFAYLLPCLAKCKVLFPDTAMGSSHLVQKLVQTQTQRPETDDGTRRAHLVVVTAHQFLEVGEQDFDGPTLSHVADYLFQSIIPPTGDPIACVFRVIIRVEFHDEYLARPQSADPGLNQMSIHHLISCRRRPENLLKVIRRQLSSVLAHFHPLPCPVGVKHPDHPIGFQPASDIPASLTGCLPDTLGRVPGIGQQMRVRVRRRFEGGHLFVGHVNLAGERDSFLLTSRLPAVHTRRQRQLSPGQQVDALLQTVPIDHFLLATGVVVAQSLLSLRVPLGVG